MTTCTAMLTARIARAVAAQDHAAQCRDWCGFHLYHAWRDRLRAERMAEWGREQGLLSVEVGGITLAC